ncbi:MAG TPA: protein-glutamate O-methyltransferase CheR [Spongiibacteraceae bacterium]|nr:protein-glutamate O-methyltransferase CheR [Spongiibacteraceae bacterium]
MKREVFSDAVPRIGSVHAREHYEEFRVFLEKACGIVLGDNKQYLVTSRLAKLLMEYEISDLRELIRRMQQTSQRGLREAVIDAMTTNETLWFRDTHPFNILRTKLLPELQRNATGPLRIWSAACSSGQEPYSISIAVEEYRASSMGLLRQPVEIVATDLSRSMLEACKAAEYDQLSLSRGLSNDRLKRYFESVGGDRWRVKREVTQRVRFQSLNLLDSFITLGKFDVVFCRNVLIYFSGERKADILRRIHATLRPGGYLILGASEGPTDVTQLYQMVQCNPGIIYKAI